jgi:hypothetical protein
MLILVNDCILWWLKIESRTMSSSTLGVVLVCMSTLIVILIPLDGRVIKLRRGSANMHKLSAKLAEIENHSSPRLDEGAQEVCKRPF